MDTVETDWLGGIIDIFQVVVQITFAVVLLVCINPLIAILSIAATVLPTLVPRLFGRHLAAVQGSIVEETQRYNARVRDSAIGGDTVRSHHRSCWKGMTPPPAPSSFPRRASRRSRPS